MKKYFLFGVSVIMLGAILMSNSNLNANNNVGNRSGVLGAGTEGCDGSGCHAKNSNIVISIIVEDMRGNSVITYYADSTYRIRLMADAVSAPGTLPTWGLQLSGKTANGGDAGSILPITKTAVDVVDGYEVVEQTSPIPSSNNKFDKYFTWVAPNNTGTQKIMFYATMLASNDDGFASGDYYNSRIKDLTETFPSSINDVHTNLQASLSPNPTSGKSFITIDGAKAGQKCQVAIFNSTGSIVRKESINNSAAGAQIPVELTDMANGLYFVHITDNDGKRAVMPIIKQ